MFFSKGVSSASLSVLAVICIGACMQLMLHVALARLLGVENYGYFAFGFSVYTLLVLFVKFSGDTQIIRDLSVSNGGKRVEDLGWFLCAVPSVIFLIVIISYLVAVYFCGAGGPKIEVVGFFLCVVPIGVALKYAMAYARVRGRIVLSQVGDQIFRPGITMLIFLLAGMNFSIGNSLAVAAFAGGVLSAIFVTLFPLRLSESFDIMHIFGRRLAAARLRSAGIMTFISGQNVAIKQVDLIFLGLLSAPLMLGSYAAATKIALVASFMLSAVNMVIAPQMSRAFHDKNLPELRRIIRQASRLIAAFSLLIWIAVVLFAERLLGFFGPEFAHAGTALKLLITGQLINSLAGPVGTLMNMTHQEAVSARVLLISFLFCLSLNLVLIPRYGDIGAAVAYTSSILMWNVFLAIHARISMGINTTVFQS